MYFGHKHVESGTNCSQEELATFLKYHKPLMTFCGISRQNSVPREANCIRRT